MFKTGKKYSIKMLEYGDGTMNEVTHHNCVVTKIDLPLIKYQQHGKERVLNTSSVAFVSAELQDG